MNKDEAQQLADEHNKILAEGQEMYEKLDRDGKRIQEIRELIKLNGFGFDEIALIFGAELVLD